MRIFQEEEGILGKGKPWLCVHECYIYITDTLEDLIEILNTEWEQDQHLSGIG